MKPVVTLKLVTRLCLVNTAEMTLWSAAGVNAVRFRIRVTMLTTSLPVCIP